MGLFGTLFSWVRGFADGHGGIDLSAPTGTPIYAVAGGTVTYARNEGTDPHAPSFTRGGGNVVNVNVGGRIQNYAHLSTINVRPGQTITPGTLIGRVGMTGGPSPYYPNIAKPTGPHLHFAVYDAGFKNPLNYVSKEALIKAVGGVSIPTNDGGNQTGETCAWVGVNGKPGICFTTGHVLTPDDILKITRQLRTIYPNMSDVDETIIQNALLNNLLGHKWDTSIYTKIQTVLAATGDAVNIGPEVGGIAESVPNAIAGFGRLIENAVAMIIAVVFIIVGVKLYAQGTSQPTVIQA